MSITPPVEEPSARISPQRPHFATLRALGAQDLTGKVVMLRIDGSELADDTRAPAIPSLDLLPFAGARIVLLSHAEADGIEAHQIEAHRALWQRLCETLGRPIGYLDHCRGADVQEAVARVRDGDVLMLGNLALEPDEKENGYDLACFLAELGDLYCDDAFSLAHQVRASTTGIAGLIPKSVSGIEFERALTVLTEILEEPARPFLAVFGGALSISQMVLLEDIAARADVVLVGGEVCLPFLKAEGRSIGASTVSEEAVAIAAQILADSRHAKRTLLTPQDFAAVDRAHRGHEVTVTALREGRWPETLRPTDCDAINPRQRAGDIGTLTRRTWGEQLASARTIFWHGPLGICESAALAAGTEFLADQIASRTWPSVHKTVICGQSLFRALRQHGFSAERVHYFNPAGAATLRYAARRPLAAVEALRRSGSPFRPTVVLALSGAAEDDNELASFAGNWLTETSVIHCIHAVDGADEREHPDIYTALTKRQRLAEKLYADQTFAHAEAVLAAHGLMPASCKLVHGDPSNCLVTRARQVRADIILMHDARGVSGGYSTTKVARQADCEVLCLPARI